MRFTNKNRSFIQYSLVIITLLIQVIILIFFYNEFFNGKKLTEIKTQLEEAQELKVLTNDSKTELFNAQNSLRNYLKTENKSYLNAYFQSLKTVTKKIDSLSKRDSRIGVYKVSELPETQGAVGLRRLRRLVDSLYRHSSSLVVTAESLDLDPITIKTEVPRLEYNEVVVKDSTPPKKFFSRLRDAFSGSQSVKTDTVFITATYKNGVDTNRIKSDMDSTLNRIHENYLTQIGNYQQSIKDIQANNQKVYNIYDNLIYLSNNLIEVYESNSGKLQYKLEQQYEEQNSKLNKIREYAIFGLILLMLLALICMAYFTKLSFLYEKKLKEANDYVQSNLKFKNRILGMLSHEIRSPLKIINLFVKRIAKRTEDEQVLQNLKSIKFTNESLLLQAGQILDYTRNQEKQITLNRSEFNLKEEINLILTAFRPYIESINNQFETSVAIPDELVVWSDKGKIHQIFTNLLGNANKFTENGRIKVIVKAQEIGDSMIKFEATISDNGQGISEADLQSIFEPFYQGTISDQVQNLGAGLGLNLCKEIIELLEGHISIESQLGKGTEIAFNFNMTKINEG